MASKRKFDPEESNIDIAEAEIFARKCLIRRERVHGEDSINVAFSLDALIRILELKEDWSDETKNLYERSLKIYISSEGADSINVASASDNIGNFYMKLSRSLPPGESKKDQLNLAEPYIKEAVRIATKLDSAKFGPSHARVIKYSSNLSKFMRLQRLACL
jgi:hypothetical protein